jgi:hypothetical protein
MIDNNEKPSAWASFKWHNQCAKIMPYDCRGPPAYHTPTGIESCLLQALGSCRYAGAVEA